MHKLGKPHPETKSTGGIIKDGHGVNVVDSFMKTQKIARLIECLRQRWAEVDTRLLRSVFPLLAEGHPVPAARIAETANTDPLTVEQALQIAHAGFDGAGAVTELFGVTLAPTSHRVEANGISLFSCCALVAQMVPHFLGATVQVESIDPVTRQLVRITTTPDGVKSVVPANAACTLVAVESLVGEPDIAALFCNHVNHFVSAETAGAFAAEHPNRFVVGIEEMFQTGQRLYEVIWS